MSLILNILAGAFTSAGKEAVVAVLQKLHDNDPKNYKVALLGGRLLSTAMDPVVDKTKTKIDDALVDGIGEAVKKSAELNNIDLSIFDSFIEDATEKLG
jgi:hypothetical protein